MSDRVVNNPYLENIPSFAKGNFSKPEGENIIVTRYHPEVTFNWTDHSGKTRKVTKDNMWRVYAAPHQVLIGKSKYGISNSVMTDRALKDASSIQITPHIRGLDPDMNTEIWQWKKQFNIKFK